MATETTVLTVKELAYRWRVSTDRIYEMVKSKRIKAFKVGGGWRIPLSAVEKFEDPSVPPVTNAKGKPVLQIS